MPRNYFTSMTEATQQYAILVTNLDSHITERQLSDFFSFCGKITSLSLRKKDDTVEGVLYFENQSSAKTALLLSNALINDKPMQVQEYTEQQQEVHDSEDQQAKEKVEQGEEPEIRVVDMPQEDIVHREGGQRTATAAVASIIASGYILAIDSLSKAKQIDEEKQISDKVNDTTNTMKNKAAQIDQQYGISEKASATSKQISDQWNQFDTQYNISESTAAATSAMGNTVSGWGNTVATGIAATLQTPSVQNTLSSVSSWTSKVGNTIGGFLQPAADTVSREYTDLKLQTSEVIQAKQKEREVQPLGDIQMEELGDADLTTVEFPEASQPNPGPAPEPHIEQNSEPPVSVSEPAPETTPN